jgi:methylation protein EvaC
MIKNCRLCNSDIKSFMTFGKMPIANGFCDPKSETNEFFYEMSVGFCKSCYSFQLLDNPEPESMFNDNYAFYSGTSNYMKIHFREFFDDVIDKYNLNPNQSFIVEIGSNDGILLENFKEAGFNHLGIEPSGNVADVAISKGINCKKSFFDDESVSIILNENKTADLIVAANVICHVPDLNNLASNVEKLLSNDGVFVFEEPYLADMINKTSYDQIYDEHIYIFSALALSESFKKYGLKLIDAENQKTHGGSMRYHFAKVDSSRQPTDRSIEVVKKEREQGLHLEETFIKFRENCEESKKNLYSLLSSLKDKGHSICGYGATSKSTTILNYCNIGSELISFISDTTPIKQGKVTPGMHIPVVDPSVFHRERPDYTVLFAWNHEAEILAKESDYTENIGKWIRFVPKVEII